MVITVQLKTLFTCKKDFRSAGNDSSVQFWQSSGLSGVNCRRISPHLHRQTWVYSCFSSLHLCFTHAMISCSVLFYDWDINLSQFLQVHEKKQDIHHMWQRMLAFFTWIVCYPSMVRSFRMATINLYVFPCYSEKKKYIYWNMVIRRAGIPTKHATYQSVI